MEENFDYMIAGAGLAGVALANRLHQQLPDARILVLEKEPVLGGRLRAISGGSISENSHIDEKSSSHGYGLGAISPELLNFVADYTSLDPSEIYNLPEQKRLAILAAARVQEIPITDMMNPVGFRALGGAAAARDWKNLASIWETNEDDPEVAETSFLNLWKGKPKKSPAAIVLQHYVRVLGIADMWNASLTAIKERTALQSSGLRLGGWTNLLNKMSTNEDKLVVLRGCRIAKAEQMESGQWHLVTEKGSFFAPSLIVAQPPWQALDWLPKPFWPKEVLALTTKTTPVSAVTLSSRVVEGDFESLADVYLIPAEEIQIIKCLGGELCFQSTIDYENSLQSENVVKSVKKLKRAHRKFLEAYPGYKLDGEFVALVSTAWSQSPEGDVYKYIRDFETSQFSNKSLAFCGDAYGASYDGDKNMMTSLTSAFAELTT